jgi:8-oxo-dGTP pyrophosphatase MutT (NUDIX family)
MQRMSVTENDLRRAVLSPGRRLRSDDDLNPGLAPASRALRAAAVLCAVVPRADGLRVVLTQRPETMRQHAGQIAFPGGKVDPTDASPLAAALREAREEVGLTHDLVDVIGPIDPYETRTGFAITPFVALVSPRFRPMPCEREVAAVFEAPLDHLMDFAAHERHTRVFHGTERHFWAIPWQDWFIWGATAGMLRGLAERVQDVRYGGDPVARPAAAASL